MSVWMSKNVPVSLGLSALLAGCAVAPVESYREDRYYSPGYGGTVIIDRRDYAPPPVYYRPPALVIEPPRHHPPHRAHERHHDAPPPHAHRDHEHRHDHHRDPRHDGGHERGHERRPPPGAREPSEGRREQRRHYGEVERR
ncbi:MAG: hypothetical protein ACOZAQ_05915 [Pseudomonadota bacterium]